MGQKTTPDDFSGFWTLEPNQLHLNNLDVSGVKRMQLTYTLARDEPQVLDLLHGKGISVLLRSTPEDMATGEQRAEVLANVKKLKPRANLVGFMGWNEVEQGINWMYENPDGSPADWRRDLAQQHAADVSAFADAWYDPVTGVGVPLIAPPWSVHSISEDEAPQPGMLMWTDETRYAYVKCKGGRGAHWYAYDWDMAGQVNCNGSVQGGVNVNKVRLKLRGATDATLCHQLLWVEEVGIKKSSRPQYDKMWGYCEIFDWLLSPQQQRPGYMGTRVVHFAPFVWNGSQEWRDQGYTLDDPAAFEMLGQRLKTWCTM